jgi:hypothetical protein
MSNKNMITRRRSGSLEDLILERHAFGIVLLEPCLGRRICEQLQMIGIAACRTDAPPRRNWLKFEEQLYLNIWSTFMPCVYATLGSFP